MNEINLDKIKEYVNINIVDFHQRRIKSLETLNLNTLLKKNPYLYKAKNLLYANDLITGLLDAFLSSSEEKLFGDFFEDLAIFIAKMTTEGHKSSAPGVDLEFLNNNTHYVVSIKSGANWGNSSQQKRLVQDLKEAVLRLKQSKLSINVQPVLGICYGKTRTSFQKGYLKIVGQNFWYFISENKDLYIDIIDPIGYHAKENNEIFLQGKANIVNKLTKQLVEEFCDSNGEIDWVKLVQHNSCNFDLLEVGF